MALASAPLAAHGLRPSFDHDDPALCRGIEGSFPLFAAVVNAMRHEGNAGEIIRATQHGDHCSWFRIGRIEAKDGQGQTRHFFVKYGAGEIGKDLLEMEFHSQKKLYSMIPDNVPMPIAWGDLGLRKPHHGTFFLTQFVQFDDRRLPDVEAAGELIARLHSASIGSRKTFDGLLYHVNGWGSKWQTLFEKILFQLYHYNTLSNGTDHEFETALKETIWYVVPRLLDALEEDGRKIEPCFIHGDLWNGNLGHAIKTSRLYIFDSGGYYAHSEMEFAYWKTQHHAMHENDYCSADSRHRPPSEPVNEFEDRIILYTLKPCLLFSSMHPGHITRQRALDNKKHLLQKYRPQDSLGSPPPVDPVYKEITDGNLKHLLVREYPPEIATFIDSRRSV
ncbi:Fructosamine kinase-domain-containing protein [Podospora aff. communis PSN243]|uniref:protein-ribulosamine 3-kinase n=1 Tax=Podospora aff. communis PSN243 TaxID=3040156 RepID=A0AAV9FX51_9PEZI|nr:Fructosamine kinase-domain-containing protein [Podospora aff. communis PSN243]